MTPEQILEIEKEIHDCTLEVLKITNNRSFGVISRVLSGAILTYLMSMKKDHNLSTEEQDGYSKRFLSMILNVFEDVQKGDLSKYFMAEKLND